MESPALCSGYSGSEESRGLGRDWPWFWPVGFRSTPLVSTGLNWTPRRRDYRRLEWHWRTNWQAGGQPWHSWDNCPAALWRHQFLYSLHEQLSPVSYQKSRNSKSGATQCRGKVHVPCTGSRGELMFTICLFKHMPRLPTQFTICSLSATFILHRWELESHWQSQFWSAAVRSGTLTLCLDKQWHELKWFCCWACVERPKNGRTWPSGFQTRCQSSLLAQPLFKHMRAGLPPSSSAPPCTCSQSALCTHRYLASPALWALDPSLLEPVKCLHNPEACWHFSI